MSRRAQGARGALATVAASALLGLGGVPCAHGEIRIVSAPDAKPLERLAARELWRYIYLRTGERPVLADALPASGGAGDVAVLSTDEALSDQQYRFVTDEAGTGRKVLRITGGSGCGVLYGAYHAIRAMGVEFCLDGDVIPDTPAPAVLPSLTGTYAPLFDVRGIQPFHDFTEGPDWWELNDYKAYLSQLAKMRMNFLGLHCYPEGGVGPEPLVWIGVADDIDNQGRVLFSAPSRWASTMGGAWGYAPTPTSEFAAGAALLFPWDDFGASTTRFHRPKPVRPEDCNTVFNQAGDMLADAFAHGRALGVRICVGTETPLTIPASVAERLRGKGVDPKEPETARKVYEGMFERIRRKYPVDYYWLWTPEGWTWGGNKQAQYEATLADIRSALGALDDLGNPFSLATCGWVLGPAHDRAALDNALPKACPMSCINRNVGFQFVEPAFARIEGRPKWAIPWLEDDPALTVPQLWVGRTRRDAADALAYGCTGLFGIHWRVRAMGPNLGALADAAWDQRAWNDDFGKTVDIPRPVTVDVRLGGSVANYERNAIADTDEDPVYRCCLYNLSGYRLKLPNGVYTVTLKFCEIHYDAAGKRVFGASVQGRPLVTGLDVFAKVGKNRPLDLVMHDVAVTNETLDIAFTPEVEFPFVAGIAVDGTTAGSNQVAGEPFTRRINCGGAAWRGYEADLPADGALPGRGGRARDLPADDFYVDWCGRQFGADAGKDLAAIFTHLDGGAGDYSGNKAAHLPRPATWIKGPGGIAVNGTAWKDEARRYAFVEQFAALQPRVHGAGELERFDYWLSTFRFLRACGELGCVRGALDRAVKEMDAAADPAAKTAVARDKAIPARLRLARLWELMMTDLLQTVSTPGELGTIANLEQHTRRTLRFLDAHDAKLVKILGHPLPPECEPSREYTGPARLIVPTKRSLAAIGERVNLRAMVLSAAPPSAVVLRWRPLGEGPYRVVPFECLGRRVYETQLPAIDDAGLEYYVEATAADGKTLLWPPAAPVIGQTIVPGP